MAELSRRERKEIRRRSVRASDGVMRCRCKIILNLVRGKTPTMIAHGGLWRSLKCIESPTGSSNVGWWDSPTGGKTMERPRQPMRTGWKLLRLIEGSPQEHGYRRPTWTQELLILVVAERTGIRVSVTTMCRLLRRLGVRLNRPKPTVDCPWPRSRRTRRLRAIQRLVDNLAPGEVALYLDEVDIHLNPRLGQTGRWPVSKSTSALRDATRSVTSPALLIPKPASSHGSRATGRTASCSLTSFTNS